MYRVRLFSRVRIQGPTGLGLLFLLCALALSATQAIACAGLVDERQTDVYAPQTMHLRAFALAAEDSALPATALRSSRPRGHVLTQPHTHTLRQTLCPFPLQSLQITPP